MEKEQQGPKVTPVPKRDFNPIWALFIMGVLIAMVLIAEVLGFKK